jgi:anti-sigma regulatory factor (Ser/Thr protein kinase)
LPVPDTVALDLGFDSAGLYGMRAAVAAHASRLGAAEEELEGLLIVASELATNAIRHGGGSGRLRLWRTDGRLCCEVSDEGPGIADPEAGSKRPELTQIGGRGLWITRQLCEQLTLVNTAPGTTAVAVMPADDAGSSPQR